MTLAAASRTALVTVAITGAAVLGTQVAQADGTATPATTAGVTGPTATPSPSTSTDTNPWD
ncbi:hypothetical protein [Streptomyces antarcticus]|uniref:hypothetical protein n=1 Tax=Streptomyces antarcticus TaxID=2996458 RepID=UPI00226FA692|nr:hypothetical protein [Streptomyces sp. H34-AA3]MCY0944324.1 hypothetical protein [Streptomyces sp. H34-AA3]